MDNNVPVKVPLQEAVAYAQGLLSALLLKFRIPLSVLVGE